MSRIQCWHRIAAAVADQYAELPDADKAWLRELAAEVADVQQQLAVLFDAASGEHHCTNCRGACCELGHNHMTLVNLLMCLERQFLPLPEFHRTCPFLGDQGCVLPVVCRPFACVTFICDMIENGLTIEECELFYRLEGQLRSLYQECAERYQGASMTGLLLQLQRLDGRPFFSEKFR